MFKSILFSIRECNINVRKKFEKESKYIDLFKLILRIKID